MKHKFIIITLITALLLTGCNSNDKSTAPETTTSEPLPVIAETDPPMETKPAVSTEEAKTTVPAKKPESDKQQNRPAQTVGKGSSSPDDVNKYINGVEIPENVYGPDLVKIEKNDITDLKEVVSIDGKPIWHMTCDGFAYLALPSGLCFNNFDNPDLDKNEATAYLKFRRYNVGDEVMGFTVKNAYSVFNDMNPNEEISEVPRLYMGGAVTLEGKATMEGYIRIAPNGSHVMLYENEIIFIPSPDNQLLPISNIPETISLTGISELPCHAYGDNTFTYLSEYPAIILDSAKVNNFNLDDMPKGEYIKASVTVDGITMKAIDTIGIYFEAVSAEIEF